MTAVADVCKQLETLEEELGDRSGHPVRPVTSIPQLQKEVAIAIKSIQTVTITPDFDQLVFFGHFSRLVKDCFYSSSKFGGIQQVWKEA
jgi:hypothetical protein